MAYRSGGGKVATELLDDRAQEFPRVDERVVGRRHRYGYSAAVDNEEQDEAGFGIGSALLKHDLSTGAVDTRPLRGGCRGGHFRP